MLSWDHSSAVKQDFLDSVLNELYLSKRDEAVNVYPVHYWGFDCETLLDSPVEIGPYFKHLSSASEMSHQFELNFFLS